MLHDLRLLYVGRDSAAIRPCGLTLYSDALMRGLAAKGHEVTYFFAGRHYPVLKRPRVRRWSSDGIAMQELLESPINSHWSRGTRYPERDLDERVGMSAFAAALRHARPDVVHVNELAGLPSSIVDAGRTPRRPQSRSRSMTTRPSARLSACSTPMGSVADAPKSGTTAPATARPPPTTISTWSTRACASNHAEPSVRSVALRATWTSRSRTGVR